MGKSKPKKPNGSAPMETAIGPVVKGAVKNAASHRSAMKGTNSFPWLSSTGAAAFALVATYLFTSSHRVPFVAPQQQHGRSTKAPASVDEFQPQGRDAQCASWVRDGECENNAAFMHERCPSSCKKKKKKKAPPPPPPPKVPGPLDQDPNCATWAASGECEANPAFMLQSCAASCSGAGSEVQEAKDIHQDCAAWVSDGECYRNPAFMLQQCKASCSRFAADNDNILQDTSETCVNFALRGGCQTDIAKAEKTCRASCHIQRICANHTETVTCSKALRCEAIGDHRSDCAAQADAGKCESEPTTMLKSCLKSCSERDLTGMMRFHLPHKRTRLSPLIDLPHAPPRLAGFYQTPPQSRSSDLDALGMCDAADGGASSAKPAGTGLTHPSFQRRMNKYRRAAMWRRPGSEDHWSMWELLPGRERTPRVPHRFTKVPDESSRMVTVEHVSFSPRIRYLHHLLSPEECDHVLQVARPLFTRSPVRGSVTRVRTSTTAMLGGRHDDDVVKRIRRRIARFSGYEEDLIEPLQVVRYERGQKYEGHHDFFDVCDLDDKVSNGRRQVTFLIYLVDMPEGETGGGTRFPELNLEVAPQKGSAIVFNDCFDNGAEDQRSLHAGQPPLEPSTVKYAINGYACRGLNPGLSMPIPLLTNPGFERPVETGGFAATTCTEG